MLLTADIVKQFDVGGPRVEASIRIREATSITILFGASGAGKTTVLRCIAGLERLTSGKIVFGGEDWTTTPPQQRSVGYLFQDYALFPHLRVRDNIAYGVKRSTGVVEQVAEMVRVSDLLERAFGGSARQLVLHALSVKQTSRNELAQIRQLLDDLEGGSR